MYYSGQRAKDSADRLAREEFEAIKKRVEDQEKQIEADNILAKKLEKQERRKADRQRLEQQKAELLLKEKLLAKQRLSKSAPRLSSADGSSLRSTQDLQAKAARHAAKQQKAAADKAKRDWDSSLSIAGIRQLPGMSDGVESHLQGSSQIFQH